jgi:hypothetical protein
MAPSTKNEDKTSLLPMTLINRFEKSCDTFIGSGGKNPLSSMTLGQFAQKKEKKIYFFNKKQQTMGWMLT